MNDKRTLGEILRARGVSRRGFMKYCAATASILALPPSMIPRIASALENARRPSVIWLSFQECTGGTESLTRSAAPTVENLIFDSISLDYHHTLQAASGEAAEEAPVEGGAPVEGDAPSDAPDEEGVSTIETEPVLDDGGATDDGVSSEVPEGEPEGPSVDEAFGDLGHGALRWFFLRSTVLKRRRQSTNTLKWRRKRKRHAIPRKAFGRGGARNRRATRIRTQVPDPVDR